MKLFIQIIPLLFVNITAIQGQSTSEYGTPEERAARITDRMKEGLSLENSQKKEIYTLNLKYAQRIQEEVIDTGMNKLSAYFRIRKINAEKEKELLPMLDDTQKEQYEQMKSEAVKELLARFF